MTRVNKLRKGALEMAGLVAKTMGAGGRLIAYDNGQECIATKDGVTVAHKYYSNDPEKMAGARLLRQAAAKSVKDTGDGTTATIVIAKEFIKANLTPRQVNKVDEEVRKIADGIKGKDANKKLISVAMVSSNYDRLVSETVVKAIERGGENGLYIIREQSTPGIDVEYVTGFGFDGGYADELFINQGGAAVFRNPILLAKDELTVSNCLETLERGIGTKTPVVLIGKPDDQLLSAFLANKNMGRLDGAIVIPKHRGHSFIDLIRDLNAIGETCDSISVGRHKTIIEHHTDLTAYVSGLESSEAATDAEREDIKSRVAALKSNVAIIKVGAETVAALGERRDRVDDCIKSTLSAFKLGVVKGGGDYLLKLSRKHTGIVKKALKAPYKQIHKNASDRDLKAAIPSDIELLDSAAVIRSSLVNGWAAAKMFVSLGGAIVNVPRAE